LDAFASRHLLTFQLLVASPTVADLHAGSAITANGGFRRFRLCHAALPSVSFPPGLLDSCVSEPAA